MKKRSLSLLIAVLMVIALVPAGGAAKGADGTVDIRDIAAIYAIIAAS